MVCTMMVFTLIKVLRRPDSPETKNLFRFELLFR